MPPVGFEPKISAGERPQTYALDRAATGTGLKMVAGQNYKSGQTMYIISETVVVHIS
jgi:hypothetical protein